MMVLVDVNVLVYAHRSDASNHLRYRGWLESVVNSEPVFGLADLVLSGFLRIVTHPKIFRDPSPLDLAMQFLADLRDHPNCVHVNPGDKHWEIFTRLACQANAKGNLIPDAYLAALAIESGSEWITSDRDYSRFPGLRWRHPFD